MDRLFAPLRDYFLNLLLYIYKYLLQETGVLPSAIADGKPMKSRRQRLCRQLLDGKPVVSSPVGSELLCRQLKIDRRQSLCRQPILPRLTAKPLVRPAPDLTPWAELTVCFAVSLPSG